MNITVYQGTTVNIKLNPKRRTGAVIAAADISTLTVDLVKPSAATDSWSFSAASRAPYWEYTTAVADLDEVGTYEATATLVTTGGETLKLPFQISVLAA